MQYCSGTVGGLQRSRRIRGQSAIATTMVLPAASAARASPGGPRRRRRRPGRRSCTPTSCVRVGPAAALLRPCPCCGAGQADTLLPAQAKPTQ
jgi:hypothetical protein